MPDPTQIMELMPFAATVGIELESAEPGEVRGRVLARGDVTAVARPLHAGRTVIVVQTDLHDADGRLIAQVTQTQAVLTQQKGQR